MRRGPLRPWPLPVLSPRFPRLPRLPATRRSARAFSTRADLFCRSGTTRDSAATPPRRALPTRNHVSLGHCDTWHSHCIAVLRFAFAAPSDALPRIAAAWQDFATAVPCLARAVPHNAARHLAIAGPCRAPAVLRTAMPSRRLTGQRPAPALPCLATAWPRRSLPCLAIALAPLYVASPMLCFALC
jgi:hypothetical protein